MADAFRIIRCGRTDAQLIADHIEYEREKVESAERMERNARFCFVAGALVLVATLLHIAGVPVVEIVHGTIDAFMDSPVSPY